MIKFDKNRYLDELAYSLYMAVNILTDRLLTLVVASIGGINLTMGDQKQGFTVSGIQSDVYRKLYPRTFKQVKAQAEKQITGQVFVAGGSQSIIALFYEYGTGSHSTMPSNRWKIIDPNPLKTERQIVGRKANRPQGMKIKDYEGEPYQVIKGARGAILEHNTKGTRAGKHLPSYEVSPQMFMLKAVKALKPQIESEVLKAIKSVKVKSFITLKDVKSK